MNPVQVLATERGSSVLLSIATQGTLTGVSFDGIGDGQPPTQEGVGSAH